MIRPISRRKSSLKLEFSSKEEQEEFNVLGLLKSSKYFIVESSWFENWQTSLSSGINPGKMRTEKLLQDGSLKVGLKYPKDYKIFNIQQWIFFNAKYGSEIPIELKSPFDTQSVSYSVSIPHYLSSQCTTRTSLEDLSTLKSKPFMEPGLDETNETTSFCNIFGFFALTHGLNQPLTVLNILLGLQVFQNLLKNPKTSRFLQILNKLVSKIMTEKFWILKSVSLESSMKLIGLDQDSDWPIVMNVLEREAGNSEISNSVQVLVEFKSECLNCGKTDEEIVKIWYIDLEIHKKLEIAVEESLEDGRIEGFCENCNGFLIRKRKILTIHDVVCFKLDRSRKIPYFYKVWNKMKYRKVVEILGRKFTLNAVLCEDPTSEEKVSIFAKRGKSWYLFKDNNATRTTLSEVLDQIAVVLIYVKLET